MHLIIAHNRADLWWTGNGWTSDKRAGGRAKDIEIDLAANRIGQISFTPIDCTFPDWRRVVPTGEETPDAKNPADSAAQVHFDHRYVGDLAKMAAILRGKATQAQSVLHPVSASHPALVTFGDRADCFAVLMPMRRKPVSTATQVRNGVLAG